MTKREQSNNDDKKAGDDKAILAKYGAIDGNFKSNFGKNGSKITY